MATDQVLKWMSQDVKLSHEVNSFETDFANGYLFGEILVQYGIYQDISMFSKKTNKEAKVNNFYLIEDALRFLQVRFDGKMIHNIMQEERGAALRLLYQLKLAIQKREGPGPLETEGKTLTGLKQSTVDRKIAEKLEKTQTLAGTIKARTVGGKDIRTAKQKLQDQHLIKFEVAQKTLFDDAQANGKEEADLIASIQQRKRADNRRKLRENQEFMKEWEQEGRDNWKQNQTTRAQNIARVKYFEDREVNLYKQKLRDELIEATNEMRSGFSEFDKNLQKLGIEQNVNMEDAIRRMEEKRGIPPGQIQNFSYPATMNKIKETKKQSDFAGKERERRRRKLAVDQANTQAKLDKQKQEDQLVEKLLNLQKEEQQQAYVDLRNRKCKDMVTERRRQKAVQQQQVRERQFKEIEERRIAEVKSQEAQRKKDIEASKQEYAKLRKTERQAKRRVNIEIASGVADLLLDLAEEVYATQKSQPGNKLTKAQWREFTDIFAQGKKVSLRNISKKVVSADDKTDDEMGALNIDPNLQPFQILSKYRNEPSLHDLQEFMTSSGMFNLAQVCHDLFYRVSEEFSIAVDTQDGSLIQNPSIGEQIERIQGELLQGSNTQMKIYDQMASNRTLDERRLNELSSELSIKMAILGRTMSGKKTIAKQIQEKYGQDNIKIFSMDTIIGEALEYITPKKVEEAAPDPKAKAKKGKAEETAPADPFEGKNTEQFKKIAQSIKDQYFEDYDGELPQKVDLMSCILDDFLLVQLFMERLKLEYEGQQLSLSQEEIEAGIVKEREIEAQLADLDPEKAAQADAGKKGKAAPKGGKAPEEQLKEELDQIKQMKINGWIVVDFPRNLSQLKLLETSLSGYETKVELPKDTEKAKYEAWTRVAYPPRLVDPTYDGTILPEKSGLDGIVILKTPFAECQRRAQNRKIDPQTQIVYHMQDTPPPDDSKLQDRLEDYTDEAGDPSRMQQTSDRFEYSIDAITQWAQRFGLIDEDSGQCKAQLDMVIEPQGGEESWRQEAEVMKMVDGKVQSVIEFRQKQYEKLRDRVRRQMEIKEKMKQEQEENEKENEEIGASKKTIQEGEEEVKGDQQPVGTSGVSIPVVANVDSESQLGQNQEIDSKKELDVGIKSMRSKAMLSDHMTHSVTGRSYARSSAMFKRIQEISDKQKLTKLEEMLTYYYSDSMQQFNLLRNMRSRVYRDLNSTQKQFISYLSRKSDMQKKLNEFCESYNRFSTEFPELLENDETKDELMNRINILSGQLWEIIKQRKNESLQERQNFMEGGWVQVEMANLTSFTAKLVENEFMRFSSICAVVTGHVINEEVELQDLVKRLQERGIDSYVNNPDDEQEVGTSPILQEVSQTITGKLEGYFREQFVVELDPRTLELLKTEKMNFNIRLNTLMTWAILILFETHKMSFQVFDVLDDWVVIAVKNENQVAQKAVKFITEQINQGNPHIDSVILDDIELDRCIDIIEFTEGPPLYMQSVRPSLNLENARFSLDTLQSLYKQFRLQQEDPTLIDAETFTAIITLNQQTGQLPGIWKYAQFEVIQSLTAIFAQVPLADKDDTINQQKLFRRKSMSADFDSDRRFINWRKAYLAILLMSSPFPTHDQKKEYIKLVREKIGALSTKQGFAKIPSWFDGHEGQMSGQSMQRLQQALNDSTDNEDCLDEDRIIDIKHLIFQSYKIPNREGMYKDQFIQDLDELFADHEISQGITLPTDDSLMEHQGSKYLLGHKSLYNTLLGL